MRLPDAGVQQIALLLRWYSRSGKLPMNRRLAVVVLVCVGALVAWKFSGSGLSPAPAAPPLPSVAAPKPDADGLALERDHAAVFQRAFWRRPTAADKILHAERRDWLDDSSGVQKWQWFIAVQASATFRDWLIQDNPFELVAVAPGTELAPLSLPPVWFPTAPELAALTRYRNREGRFFVFLDLANNRLYATDAGGGFAGARK